MALPKKLNPKGCRLLGIAIIKSAIVESMKNPNFNWSFFDSELFHFYAGLAYGGKTDYRCGDDVINDVMSGKLEIDACSDNMGGVSKYS